MIDNAINMPVLHDQYTDRSGAVLAKIASRMEDRDLAALAMNTLFNMPRPSFMKTASFPVSTPEDVLLSRIYLEGQREKLAEEDFVDLDDRVSVGEIVNGMGGMDLSMRPMVKQATTTTYELMPGVVVTTHTEMVKMGEDFSKNYRQLDYADRLEFSDNFCKAAEEEPPIDVRVYAVDDIVLREDAPEQLHFRKIACDMSGQDGSCYDELAESLRNLDQSTVTREGLKKLASVVHEMDRRFGFDQPKYDSRLPDAWHALFEGSENVKVAEEIGDDLEEAESMSKADIISRFGEGSLDEVENPDGSVNRERLSQLIKEYGGCRSGEGCSCGEKE